LKYVDIFARNISENNYWSADGEEDVYTLVCSVLKAGKNSYSNNIDLSITEGSRPSNIIEVSLETMTDVKVLSQLSFFLQDMTVFQIVCGFSITNDRPYECVKVSPLRMADLKIRHLFTRVF
jgi:hypothetical protein